MTSFLYQWLERKCPSYDAEVILDVLETFGFASDVRDQYVDEAEGVADDKADWEQRKLVDEQDERFRRMEGDNRD